MRSFSMILVKHSGWLHGAASGRNPIERASWKRGRSLSRSGKQNHAVPAPRPAFTIANSGFADGLRRSAEYRDFFEFPIGEKGNESGIGRPERERCAFGTIE